MGVHVGDAGGDHPTLLECRNCKQEYETDETMNNDCPDCGWTAWDIVNTDPSAPWR